LKSQNDTLKQQVEEQKKQAALQEAQLNKVKKALSLI